MELEVGHLGGNYGLDEVLRVELSRMMLLLLYEPHESLDFNLFFYHVRIQLEISSLQPVRRQSPNSNYYGTLIFDF